MEQHFDPKIFPNRTILIDLNTHPPTEKISCTKCGKLTTRVWKNDELCKECYDLWQKEFFERWKRGEI